MLDPIDQRDDASVDEAIDDLFFRSGRHKEATQEEPGEGHGHSGLAHVADDHAQARVVLQRKCGVYSIRFALRDRRAPTVWEVQLRTREHELLHELRLVRYDRLEQDLLRDLTQQHVVGVLVELGDADLVQHHVQDVVRLSSELDAVPDQVQVLRIPQLELHTRKGVGALQPVDKVW